MEALMRVGLLLICLTLAACTDPHALNYVSRDAPMWNINPALWNANTNTLTAAPTLPAGVQPQAVQ
jgi:hypothetical protein